MWLWYVLPFGLILDEGWHLLVHLVGDVQGWPIKWNIQPSILWKTTKLGAQLKGRWSWQIRTHNTSTPSISRGTSTMNHINGHHEQSSSIKLVHGTRDDFLQRPLLLASHIITIITRPARVPACNKYMTHGNRLLYSYQGNHIGIPQ